MMLHHENDTAEHLRATLLRRKEHLAAHGLLSRDDLGELRYGFIHGEGALDNSAPAGRHCGVAGELGVLRETGCYADFTLPSARERTQTRSINSLYYARSTARLSRTTGPPRARRRAPRSRRGAMSCSSSRPARAGLGRATGASSPASKTANSASAIRPPRRRLRVWIDCRISVVRPPGWPSSNCTPAAPNRPTPRMLLGEPMRQISP